MSEMVDRVARAIDEADVGYSIRLTRLVDGVSTFTLTINEQFVGEYEDHESAWDVCRSHIMEAKGRAAIEAMREPTEAMIADVPREIRPDEVVLEASADDREPAEFRSVGLKGLWRLLVEGALR